MRLHAICYQKDEYLLFLPDTLKFFKANNNTLELARLIVDGKNYEEANYLMDGLEKPIYDSLYMVLNPEATFLSGTVDAEKASEDWSGYLPRLVLNISNDCNLRCRYCYAHGGSYLSERSNMPESVALKIMDSFFSMFEKIDRIQLFGGEPLMNVAVIKLVAKYIREHGKDTRIGIVTNGTLIDDEIASLIAEYDINVTLSIDHSKMQDILRPYANNEGTYEKILQNMHLLKRVSSQPSQLEVVYTQEHIDRGISITEALKRLQNDFGKLPIHLTRVCSDNIRYKLKNANAFIDTIDEVFSDTQLDAESDYSFTGRIISALRLKRPQTNLCSAGFGTISVSVDGDIYPCFFFTDNIDFKVSNINDPYSTVKTSIDSMRKAYYESSKTSGTECNNCFANTVCFGCLGVNNSETGDPYKASEIQCELVKRGLERVLINLAYGGK